MKQDSFEDLNSYNFLELLGIKEPTDAEVERIDMQLKALVWEKFLAEHLESELDGEGVQKINELSENSGKVEELLGAIEKSVPNLKDILQKNLLKVKKEILKEHIQTVLETTDKAISNPSASKEEREVLREKMNRYNQAKILFDKEDWSGLYDLVSSKNPSDKG